MPRTIPPGADLSRWRRLDRELRTGQWTLSPTRFRSRTTDTTSCRLREPVATARTVSADRPRTSPTRLCPPRWLRTDTAWRIFRMSVRSDPVGRGFCVPRDLGPESDLDEPSHSSFGQSYGGSGLLLTDDDLASDLGSLNLGGSDHLNGMSRGTTSQPSSLPLHAPISRAPATDRLAYQQLNMNLPSNAVLRHSIGSPVDNSVLPPRSSPLRTQVDREPDDHFGEAFGSSGQPQSQTRYFEDRGGEESGSPGGSSGGTKKDINPKKIFGKARNQDIQ